MHYFATVSDHILNKYRAVLPGILPDQSSAGSLDYVFFAPGIILPGPQVTQLQYRAGILTPEREYAWQARCGNSAATRTGTGIAALCLVLLLGCAGATWGGEAGQEGFEFALIGDQQYDAASEAQFRDSWTT